MLRKPAHFIFYLSTLQKPAAGAGFCNVLKYKDDTFYLSTIQKPAPGMVGRRLNMKYYVKLNNKSIVIKIIKSHHRHNLSMRIYYNRYIIW